MALALQVLFFLYFLQDEDSAAIIAIGADKSQGCLARCVAGGGRANKFPSIWQSHSAFRTRAIRLAPARVRYSPSSKIFSADQEAHNTPTLGRGTGSQGE